MNEMLTNEAYTKAKKYKNILQTFIDHAETLENKIGVYHFQTISGENEYIGVSSVMGRRVLTSYKERIQTLVVPCTCKFYFTNTVADAYVLEIYLINKLKPKQNISRRAVDELSIELVDYPKPTIPIAINYIGPEHLRNLRKKLKQIQGYIDQINQKKKRSKK